MLTNAQVSPTQKNGTVLCYSVSFILLKCDNSLTSHTEKVISLLHTTYFCLTVRCTLSLALPTLSNNPFNKCK